MEKENSEKENSSNEKSEESSEKENKSKNESVDVEDKSEIEKIIIQDVKKSEKPAASNFQNLDFRSLRHIDISDAPVLDQRAESLQQVTNLEEQVSSESPRASSSLKNSSDNEFKYSVGGNLESDANNPKYISTSQISTTPERVDMANVGRKRESVFGNEMNFNPSQEARGTDSSFETYIAPERMDVENLGRERVSEFNEKDLSRKMKYENK